MSDEYRTTDRSSIRVLFCFGVRPDFFAAEDEERQAVIEVIRSTFDDLAERFGIEVLGTMDDDEVVVGPAETYPWTAYILADVPSYGAASAVCDLVRTTPVGRARLWKYLKIEARLGRRLFFGNR